MLGSDQNGGESELNRLWSLLSELSAQLSHNRQQTEDLHRRADELKTQAIHTQTGFTLRRFNTDITKEEFESELERLNVTLVLENQSLQQENRQLSSLLKDYEGTLESVMGKFRAHAYATQSHHLDLTRHYESILLALPSTSLPLQQTSISNPSIPSPTTTEASLTTALGLTNNGLGSIASGINGEGGEIDPLHLSLSLAHLSTLIRKALRSLGGEEPEEGDEDSEEAERIVEFDTTSVEGKKATPEEKSIEEKLEASTSISNESNASSESPPIPIPSSSHRRDLSTGGYIGLNASTNPHYIPTTSTSSLVASPPKEPAPSLEKVIERTKDKKRRDDQFRSLGPLDKALEEESELLGIRRENEGLRRMLFGVANENERVKEEEVEAAKVVKDEDSGKEAKTDR